MSDIEFAATTIRSLLSEAEAEESSFPKIVIVYLLHLLSLPDVRNSEFEETLYCANTDITDICTVVRPFMSALPLRLRSYNIL